MSPFADSSSYLPTNPLFTSNFQKPKEKKIQKEKKNAIALDLQIKGLFILENVSSSPVKESVLTSITKPKNVKQENLKSSIRFIKIFF